MIFQHLGFITFWLMAPYFAQIPNTIFGRHRRRRRDADSIIEHLNVDSDLSTHSLNFVLKSIKDHPIKNEDKRMETFNAGYSISDDMHF